MDNPGCPGSTSYSLLAGRGAGFGEDGFDDFDLGVGIVLDVGPGLGGEVALGLSVAVAGGGDSDWHVG